jgi:hypothetical protein
MLELKSIIKTREQLLATGWEENKECAYFYHLSFNTPINPSMVGGIYYGIVKDATQTRLIGTKDDSIIWTLYPEMVLLVDQWGFVRDPETLNIIMWDVITVGHLPLVVNLIRFNTSFPIDVANKSYTTDGRSNDEFYPTLSKYPYSIEYGGYTPFDYKELQEALSCPKSITTVVSIPKEYDSNEELITKYIQDNYEYKLTRTKFK